MLADMLSRAPVSRAHTDEDNDDVEVHAIRVVASLVSEANIVWLTQETNDSYLKSVIESLRNNRPIDGQLKPYLDELTEINGVLFKGCKVVIPATMRPEILHRIQDRHMGLNKCKSRARLFFWPGMNADIDVLMNKCSLCRKYAYKQPSEPVMIRPVPANAWYRVGVDMFEYAGCSYLCA